MATKKTAKKTSGNKVKKVNPAAAGEVTVRMYRQGLGDCFLVTLPTKDGKPFYIMIDCGVILGTPDAAGKMQKVAADIAKTTNGHIDLLVATHEHWDHLSGFLQAQDQLKGITFDNVWVAWTEDPADELARELSEKHKKLRIALVAAATRLRLSGESDGVIDGMLEFFGAAGQGTTRDALKIVKGFHDKPRFCLPADAPVKFDGVDARFYVLGPPHDLKLIKRFNPSKADPETFDLMKLYLDRHAPQIVDADLNAPFDPIAQIPMDAARQVSFFQTHYWGESARPADTDKGVEDEETDQSWRRIDGAWLDFSSALALALDAATNNTSLVLAIELADDRVLLFAADAQVGNWLSWQDLSWTVDGKTVTGPELLRRTVLYKTGHHGSHNATLKEKGLDMMENLKVALIPVDHEMAKKKGWGKMPLDTLEQALNQATEGRVLRIDRPIPAALEGRVRQDESESLYYEVKV